MPPTHEVFGPDFFQEIVKETILARVQRALLEVPAEFWPDSQQIEAWTRWLEAPDWTQPLQADEVWHIVHPEGRPALLIQQGLFDVNASDMWRESLAISRQHLIDAIQSVGRIEVWDSTIDQRHVIGTGWMAADNIMITNRHVARCFAKGVPPFSFKTGAADFTVELSVSVDFQGELDVVGRRAFPVVRVEYIAEEGGPDIAFLRVGDGFSSAHQLPRPIPLATDLGDKITAGRQVVAIGYPAYPSHLGPHDPNSPCAGEERDILVVFGARSSLGFKRLSPGQIMSKDKDPRRILARGCGSAVEFLDNGQDIDTFLHDCSTLPGSSGSCVIDLETGEALGIHFYGHYCVANHAVQAAVIADRLHQLEL